jgi:hypothetical protein
MGEYIMPGGVCLKKSEPILRRTLIDRLRFAPAERSGAAEFPTHPHRLEPPTFGGNSFGGIQNPRNFLAETNAEGRSPEAASSANLKVRFWCIYTTTLEPILAKIAEADEPAASRRKAAACLAEKLSLQF